MTIRALARGKTRLLVVLALTAIYYAVPWPALPYAGILVGLPFLLFYCVFIPGAAIDRALNSPFVRDGRDGFVAVASWAFFGIAVLLACTFVWALAGVSVSVFARALPAVVVILAWVAHKYGNGSPRGVEAPQGALADHAASSSGRRKVDRRLTIAFALFVAVVGLLVLWAGPPIDYGKDTLDYVGYTNEIARTGEPFPHTAFYIDPGPNGADLRKGLLHSSYGYFKWYLGVDSLALFRALGAFLIALVLLAVYSATLELFGSRAVAALAGLFFVIGFDGGIRSDMIRCFFYPNRFAVGYLLLFLAAALRFLERPTARGLVLCAVFSFAATAVHIQYTVLLGFVVATILVWKTCFAGPARAHAARTVTVGVAAVMGMLPFAAFRYLTAYQAGGASGLHTQIQSAVFVTDRLFVAEPVHIWQGAGLLGLATLLAVVALWRVRRENAGVGYIIASLLTVVLIQLNPLAMPVFYRFITYLVFRLWIICPFYMLAAYVLVAGLSPARGRAPAWGRGRPAAVVVTLLAVAASLAPVFGQNAFSPSRIDAERSSSYLRWADGLQRLRELPGRAVIASDPITSYVISAFTPHYVVCTFDQHAPPSDLFARERTIAARDILSPFTSGSDKSNQAQAHRVTHVVVNEDLGVQSVSDYWTVGRESEPLVTSRFGALETMFDDEGAGDGLRVYRWTGKAPRHVGSIQNPLLRRRVPAEAQRVGEAAGLARCEAAQIVGPASSAPGEAIEVNVFWAHQEELPLDKYVVAIRFDRADLELPYGGKPFPKLTRKIKEKLTGERYRFRQDHKIIDGFLSPDTWPPGVFVHDRTIVRVPNDVAEGRYTVRAKLLTRPTSPNHRLRDFFFDDDVYQGAVIGEITIRRTE